MIYINGMKAYTTSEAAAIIGIEAPSVRRIINEGAIKAHKISGQYYITAESLLEYQRKRKGFNYEEAQL